MKIRIQTLKNDHSQIGRGVVQLVRLGYLATVGIVSAIIIPRVVLRYADKYNTRLGDAVFALHSIAFIGTTIYICNKVTEYRTSLEEYNEMEKTMQEHQIRIAEEIKQSEIHQPDTRTPVSLRYAIMYFLRHPQEGGAYPNVYPIRVDRVGNTSLN